MKVQHFTHNSLHQQTPNYKVFFNSCAKSRGSPMLHKGIWRTTRRHMWDTAKYLNNHKLGLLHRLQKQWFIATHNSSFTKKINYDRSETLTNRTNRVNTRTGKCPNAPRMITNTSLIRSKEYIQRITPILTYGHLNWELDRARTPTSYSRPHRYNSKQHPTSL